MDEFYEDAVIDMGYGTATPLFAAGGDNNPTDYDLPEEGGVNEWEQNRDSEPWSATADVKFVDGQATLPLRIYDDALDGEEDESIEWKLTNESVPFGFSQETYVFSENDDVNSDPDVGTTVNIPLSLDSPVKTATIFIFDSDFQPILGDASDNTLDNVGDGDDFVFASEGNDYVDGGNGNDQLYGQTGNDTLLGNSGSDYLNGDVGDDKLSGGTGNDTLNGGIGSDTLIGGTGSDYLNGDVGNDKLSGGTGNDTLDSGIGSDTLIGGTGNDTYIVDSTEDTITEYAKKGVDTVESSVDFTLGNNLENLTLTGDSDISGTGNALDNIITGNDGINTLIGGKGNDTYIVNYTTDTIIEYADEGVDTVESGDSFTLGDNLENLTLTWSSSGTGNALNNVITGSHGDDSLDGGFGIDTLIGGLDNDTYIVDSTTDTIIEYADFYEGYLDTVESSVSYTLGDNLENLTLTGSNDISAIGNSLDNVITSNDGSNTLSGGAGNDTYKVNSTEDTITEYAKKGVDTVESSVSYTLGDNLENLTLTGISDISGTGNALDNVITGNSFGNNLYGDYGNDTLVGDYGNDTLTGGAGADIFDFFYLSDGIDTISDFNSLEADKIQVSAFGFGIELTEYNRFKYDSSTGALFFDQTQFASLQSSLNFVPIKDITIVDYATP